MLTIAQCVHTNNLKVLVCKWSPGATTACRKSQGIPESSHSGSDRGRECEGCQ